MLKTIFHRSKLFNATFLLSGFGLLAILTASILPASYIGWFSWLFLYMPFLWIIWIACIIFGAKQIESIYLFGLWIFINFEVLLLFCLFSLKIENWTNSSGADLVILASDFPVVMPALLFFKILFRSDEMGLFGGFKSVTKIVDGGVGEVIAVWMFLSVVAAFQSLCIFAGWNWLRRRA